MTKRKANFYRVIVDKTYELTYSIGLYADDPADARRLATNRVLGGRTGNTPVIRTKSKIVSTKVAKKPKR